MGTSSRLKLDRSVKSIELNRYPSTGYLVCSYTTRGAGCLGVFVRQHLITRNDESMIHEHRWPCREHTIVLLLNYGDGSQRCIISV